MIATTANISELKSHILNAAGTPMIRPFPVSSLARLILLPGEPSVKTSKSGMRSPTFTKTGLEAWKAARCEEERADRARGKMDATRTTLRRAKVTADMFGILTDDQGRCSRNDRGSKIN